MVLSTYDVIVVGGDPIGLFAAHQWARAGKKVLLLEQFEFFNERASCKGDSRFFRIIYADVRLSLLAQSAYALWRELEREAEATLLTCTGAQFYGIAGNLMTREGNLKSCLQVMDAHVEPEPLDPQACIYPMTPDHNFVLDLIPGHDNIALFTSGTGQAFKYTPLLGKILSQLALGGKTEYNIEDFSIHRPDILTATESAL